MNKMSFNKLKELFFEKYPNGAIFKDTEYTTCMAVAYDKKQKVYHYSYTNYLNLAKRLKLIDNSISYKRDIEYLKKQIEMEEKRLQEVIDDIDTFYIWSKEEEIEYTKKKIKELKDTINTCSELA